MLENGRNTQKVKPNFPKSFPKSYKNGEFSQKREQKRGNFHKNGRILGKEREKMQKKNFKGKCVKQKISKSDEICRTYNDLATAYLKVLEDDDEIVEIRTNVLMDGLELGEYTNDFVCRKLNGDLAVMADKLGVLPAETEFSLYDEENWLHTEIICDGMTAEIIVKSGETEVYSLECEAVMIDG